MLENTFPIIIYPPVPGFRPAWMAGDATARTLWGTGKTKDEALARLEEMRHKKAEPAPQPEHFPLCW